MSVIDKIEEIQVNLMSHEFPKSGYNPFNKNHYHELKDILPPILSECHEKGLVLLYNFTKDEAILDVTNKDDKNDFYRFTLPMPELVQMNKKINLVQTIGANSTYLKRYLLMNAFLVLEDDVADALIPEDDVADALIPEDDVADAPKKESAPKNDKPEVIDKAIADLKKKGLAINKCSLWSKCNQLKFEGSTSKEVTDWIKKHCEAE